MFNSECGADVLEQLKNMFKFSDAVIRNLVVRMDRPVTEPSPMMREESTSEGDERPKSRRDSNDEDEEAEDTDESADSSDEDDEEEGE